MRRPTDAPHRVVIVGGGYGGLSAARALRRAPVDVALVDRAGHHLVQPLLSRLATGALTDREVALPLHGILRRQRNARLVHAEVSEIDLGARRLEPLGLEYDSLIVAAGTTHPHRGEEDGAHLAPGLKSLADAGRIGARTVLWAAGVEPSPLADASGARVDGTGRIVVCGDLTLPRHPEVFAIGDIAAAGGLPHAAPVAVQQGRHAARIIRARLAGRRTPGTFRVPSHGSLKTRPYNPPVTI